MRPIKVRIDKAAIHALFIAADGHPMPGQTFTFDGTSYTVHTVAHAWHTRGRAIIATAERNDP